MKAQRIVYLFAGALFCALLVVSSCNDSKKPTEPGGGVVPQDSLGILLSGDPGAPATNHTTSLYPSPVGDQDVDDSLLIRTRLQGVIAPGATVGQVNAALTAIGARIVCMVEGMDVVTLRIAAIDSRAEADSLCTELTSSGAFAFAFPAYEVSVEISTRELPLPPDDTGLTHLRFASAPAAWNARAAMSGASNVNVLVPDQYWGPYSDPNYLSASPEITNQTFLLTGGATCTKVSFGSWVGNHGYHVCGIIAASWDGSLSTGIHPRPEQLNLHCLPLAGLTWADKLAATALSLPATGPYLVSTSLGYNDPLFEFYSKTQRLIWALYWRKLIGNKQTQFLHFTAAGNDGTVATEGGDALWASPFCTAKKIGDVTALLPPGSAPEAERQKLIDYYNDITTNFAYASSALTNMVIVGSSDTTGVKSDFSSRNADIRTVGRDVYSVCIAMDPAFPGSPRTCDGARAILNGTSMATPQATGIAAYLMQLSPGIALTKVRDIMLNSYDPTKGLFDMYKAVLSVDQSPANAPVRRAILDVAGNNDAPGTNNKFDEHDLNVFLDSIAWYEDQHLIEIKPDYSRYDLNGNGVTADDGTPGQFDLDINYPPAYSTKTQFMQGQEKVFFEDLISDREILCYYAYSDFYQGDEAVRDSLMEYCVTPYLMFASLLPDSIVSIGDSVLLSVRLGYYIAPDTLWEEGVEITLIPSNGSAFPLTGITDVDGLFTSWLKPSSGAPMQAIITAVINDLQVAVDTVTIYPLQPTWAAIELTAGVRSSYFIGLGPGIVYGADTSEQTAPPFATSFNDNSSVNGQYHNDTCSVTLESGGEIDVQIVGPFLYTMSGSANDMVEYQHPNTDEPCYFYFNAGTGSGAEFRIKVYSGAVEVVTTATVRLSNPAGVNGQAICYAGPHQLTLFGFVGEPDELTATWVDTVNVVLGEFVVLGSAQTDSENIYEAGTYITEASFQVTCSVTPIP